MKWVKVPIVNSIRVFVLISIWDAKKLYDSEGKGWNDGMKESFEDILEREAPGHLISEKAGKCDDWGKTSHPFHLPATTNYEYFYLLRIR